MTVEGVFFVDQGAQSSLWMKEAVKFLTSTTGQVALEDISLRINMTVTLSSNTGNLTVQ